MPYTPKTWENKPSTASPINATNLNHMEGGIKTNDDNILGAQNAILTLQGEMLQAQGDISALETLVDSIFPVDTESGNPAVITDAFGGACKSLKLTLEPIQSGSGTPSPQNVRPISGLTEANVVRTGKNLLQMTLAGIKTLNTTGTWNNNVYTVNGMTFTVNIDDDDNITSIGLNGTANAQTIFQLGQSPSSGSYTLNGCPTGGNYNSGYSMYITGIYVVDEGAGVDFSLSGTSYMTSILVRSGAFASSATFYPMIRLSSESDATYEPYTVETITIQLGQTVYGGVLDVTTGVLTDKMLYSVYDGSEDEVWGFDDTNHVAYIQIPGINLYQIGVSNLFKGVITKAGALLNDLEFANAPGTTWVNIHYNEIDTLADWKEFLSSNNLQIIFLKATPTTVQLTAEEVTLFHGDNVLTTDADSIETSYSADIALYIAKKIAEGSQNNRSLSKGGSGDEEVKEEMKEEVKEEDIEIKEAEPLTKEVR